MFLQWNPNDLRASTLTLLRHSDLVYQVSWDPVNPLRLASASGDGNTLIWDLNYPSPKTALAQGSDVLCCAWIPEQDHVILTGGTDGLIRIWDLRNPHFPIHRLDGHEFAVRKLITVKPNLFLSASYDKTVRCASLSKETNIRRTNKYLAGTISDELFLFQIMES